MSKNDRDQRIAEMLRSGASYRDIMNQEDVSASVVARVKGQMLTGGQAELRVFDPEPRKTISFAEVAKLLRRKPMTLDDIVAATGETPVVVAAWVGDQQNRGVNLYHLNGFYSIERQTPTSLEDAEMVEVLSDEDDTFVLGACGDNHLGSKYERLDILNELYDRYADEGITHVFNTGNWVDGEARFNKFDLHTHGMDGQLEYLARVYPQRPGVHTYAVAGDDHEGWYEQSMGVNIGRHAESVMRREGRHDWHHLGFMQAFVKLVNRRSGKVAPLLVIHPGGGSSYATSYTMQKLVESFSGGDKPAVMFAGHYHKMELLNYRNVWCVQTGTTQDQTPFMRKKKIEAHMGGHVIRLKQDPRTGAIVEMNGMMRFFNKGYYNNTHNHAGPIVRPRAVQGGAA